MSEDVSKDSAHEDEPSSEALEEDHEQEEDHEDTDAVEDEDASEADDADSDAPGDAAAHEAGRGDIPEDRPDYMTAENFLAAKWRGHDIAVSGDWTIRWLFLTPTYTLWVDGEPVETTSGPRPNPSLDAVLEDESGEAFHLNATLTSIVGYKPPCRISVEEEVIAEGDIRVANFMNPFLVLFILLAVCLMILIGPDVISQYLP